MIPLLVAIMKRITAHISNLASALAALQLLIALPQGCTRIESAEKPSDSILFAPEIVTTKGMLNSEDLSRTGTKIQVYDYLTGFEGSIGNNTNVHKEDVVLYFKNKITYNRDTLAYWPYCDPATSYPWTRTGSHSFFGWLVADQHPEYLDPFTADALVYPGQLSFSERNRVLSIPATTMTTTTEQFDFSYTDVTTIDAATRAPGNAVRLQLKHMFSAFKLTVKNTSGNTILIKSVTISGMKNRRSATIDFRNDTTAVQTDNLSSVDIPIYNYASSGENDYGYPFEDSNDEVTGVLMSDFLMMWPQTYVDLTGATLDVVYRVRTTVNGQDSYSDELSAHADLSNQKFFKQNSTGMDAGTKYVFTIQFKESTIDIHTKVLPWDYEAYDWDYSDHSISAKSGMFKDGVLAFYRYNSQTGEYNVEPTTDEWSAKTMRFNARNEIMKGRFYIEAPTSGRWQVTPYPMSAAQYFIVTPTSGDIDVLTDNGMAEFTVSVNPDMQPSSTQNLYFSIAVYYNGEWHDADSEFNRKNIKLVLDAN